MIEVTLIPALEDNYCYLLRETESGQTAVVDPSEAEPVLGVLKAQGLNQLDAILNTHHHWDHVGGNEVLQAKFGCPVLCSRYDEARVPGKLRKSFADGDTISLGNAVLEVIAIPGHTLGHVAFYDPQSQSVFVGDTLFAMGCGRLFEGTPEQMFHSLSRLMQLPNDTKVYCGHEYTAANGLFALTVDAKNSALRERMESVEKLRRQKLPTIPTSIAFEKATNPFIRLPGRDASLPDHEAFAVLRKMKDNFR